MKKNEQRTPNAERRTPNTGEDGAWVLHNGNSGEKKDDLEERLLEFTSASIDLSEKAPNSRAGNHLAGQPQFLPAMTSAFVTQLPRSMFSAFSFIDQ